MVYNLLFECGANMARRVTNSLDLNVIGSP